MRFRSPMMLLLLCVVSFAMAQEIEECQQGANDELIWQYDVRRPHRIGGYQVRFRLSPVFVNLKFFYDVEFSLSIICCFDSRVLRTYS